MRNPKPVPYETIVRATSGELEAIDEVFRHYSKRIRLASLENGQVNKDTEDSKHRCTDAAMEYFKAEVMEMCHRENLYQIDLLNGSKNRVTEREYWAKRKGQAALDKENASQAATGEPGKIELSHPEQDEAHHRPETG